MSTSLVHLKRVFERDKNISENNSTEPGDPIMSDTNMSTNPLVRAIITTATGIIFGIALEKGRVFEPQVIRDQMLFKRFGMIKMFLSASAIGMVCFSLLSVLPQTMRKFGLTVQNYPDGSGLKSVFGVVTGAAMLGAGLTIAGACPGTIFVQLGTGVPNAWLTVLGGLCGAMLYAFTNLSLPSIFFKENRNPKSIYMNDLLKVSYLQIAIPMSCVMAFTVLGIEYFTPWETEVQESLLTGGMMMAGAWPPFIAGMIIGSLQIPTVLANEDGLGSARSYVTVASQLVPTSLVNRSSQRYFNFFKAGISNWWQVLHVCSAVLGGFISSMASGTFRTVPGVTEVQAFGGGMLMVFGSRLAGGCTSGHGLTGFGLLYLTSFAAVPAIFGSGILTAFFMKDVLGIEL